MDIKQKKQQALESFSGDHAETTLEIQTGAKVRQGPPENWSQPARVAISSCCSTF